MRVIEHPILDELKDQKKVTLYYNGEPVEAVEGEPIAAALMNAGIRVFRTTAKRHEPRGIFCAIGRCTDCMMIVDGIPNTRTCVTPVRDGMRVEKTGGACAAEAAGLGKRRRSYAHTRERKRRPAGKCRENAEAAQAAGEWRSTNERDYHRRGNRRSWKRGTVRRIPGGVGRGGCACHRRERPAGRTAVQADT